MSSRYTASAIEINHKGLRATPFILIDTHALLFTIGLNWCEIIMHVYDDR